MSVNNPLFRWRLDPAGVPAGRYDPSGPRSVTKNQRSGDPSSRRDPENFWKMIWNHLKWFGVGFEIRLPPSCSACRVHGNWRPLPISSTPSGRKWDSKSRPAFPKKCTEARGDEGKWNLGDNTWFPIKKNVLVGGRHLTLGKRFVSGGDSPCLPKCDLKI